MLQWIDALRPNFMCSWPERAMENMKGGFQPGTASYLEVDLGIRPPVEHKQFQRI